MMFCGAQRAHPEQQKSETESAPNSGRDYFNFQYFQLRVYDTNFYKLVIALLVSNAWYQLYNLVIALLLHKCAQYER